MKDATKDLVSKAEEFLKRHRFTDAAACFEKAAESEDDKAKAAPLLKRAGEAYAQTRSLEDAGRCYSQAGELMDNEGKAECLMAYWQSLVLEIAGCQYDCGYEWRGDTTGDHDADHHFYQDQIKQYQQEAQRVLVEALRIAGVNKREIIRAANKECRKRKKDGWGAGICSNIVAHATAEAKK